MRAAETDYPSSAAAQTYSVTFSVNGVETTVTQTTAGAAVTPVEVLDLYGYSFVGWSKTPTSIIDMENRPAIVCKPGSNYKPNQSETLYAVFGRSGKERDEGELLIYANVNGIKYYMDSTPQVSSHTVTSTTDRNLAMPYIIKRATIANTYYITYKENGYVQYLSQNDKYPNYLLSSSSSYYFFRTTGYNGQFQFITQNKAYAIMLRFVSESDNYFRIYSKEFSIGGSSYYDLNLESVLYTTKFSYDLNVSEAGYATLCLPFNAVVPEGVQVFTARHEDGKVMLEECATKKIRAGEGYIVKAVPGEYTFVATNEEVAAPAENSLVGVTETEKLHGDETIYIFAQQEGVIGFYRLVGDGNLDKNKAYLKISAPLGSRDTIHLL